MAVVRSARSSPPYALIVFIFLWVISTGLAAMFYIQGGKDHAELQKKDDQFNAIARPDEQRIAARKLLDQAGTHKALGSQVSALGEAVHQIDALHRKLNGGKGDNIEELTKQGGTIDQLIAGAGLTGDHTNLADAFTALSQEAKSQHSRADLAETGLHSAQTDYTHSLGDRQGTVESYKKSLDEREADIKKLTEQIVTLHADEDTRNKDHEQAISDLEAKQEKATRVMVTELQDVKDKLKERTADVISLQNEIKLIKGGPTVALGKEPAGKVLRASNLAGDVWINLGRRDHVSPGMTFAVYDPLIGISFDAEARGKKGDVEVVEVGENDSRARITRTEPNKQITPEDWVASLVYNKNRKYHFYLFGDFDLDGDGIATSAERERLVRLIESWGGAVDDTFTSQTDFLVLGAEPGGSALKSDAESDQTSDLVKQRTSQQKQYADLLVESHDWAVPVLNANRFLSLIGYYNPVIAK